MTIFRLVVEMLIYVSAVYLIYRKRELIIIYLPLFLFMNNVSGVSFFRVLVFWLFVNFIIIYTLYKVRSFPALNMYAVLLILYFTILFIFNSQGFHEARGRYFSMIWLFTAMIIIPNIYIRHDKEHIFSEIYKMASAVIILFIINTAISSLTGYSNRPMYGMDSGVLFGNIFAAGFNIIPIALFLYMLGNMKKISIVNITTSIIAFALLILTFRRGVVFVAILAVCIIILMLVAHEKRAMAIISFTGVVLIALFVVIEYTEYKTELTQRYERRFDERDMVSYREGRFMDHVRIYEDLFVYSRYSKLFGYEFFNAPGNYGGGVVRETRNLHPDLPVIVHASGLLGLFLYLMAVFKMFKWSWLGCMTSQEKLIWLFCLGAFLVFTLVGRVTNTTSVIAFYLLLMLPMANLKYEE